jgi:hypothetical protein
MGELVDVKATVRVGGILALFSNMRKTDYRGVFMRLRKPMRKDQRRHRDAQRGPRGPWSPLAATTKARYARDGKRRNRRILARLPNTGTSIVRPDMLILRSRAKWSGAHFAGPTRVGRGAIVPQRQFWWISSELKRNARDEFVRTLIHRWRRGR